MGHVIVSPVTLALHSYIVSNIYTKAEDLSKGLILGDCKKINSKAILDNIC